MSRLTKTKHVNFIVYYPKPQAGFKYCWDFINREVEVKMIDIYQNSTFHLDLILLRRPRANGDHCRMLLKVN